MRASLGIDFGTTNSTVCFFDGDEYRFADLEEGRATIPSLMYINREYYPIYGESARSRFLEDNLDRRISLEKTDLGYIEIAVGDNAYESFDHTGFAPAPTTFDAKITAFTDQNLPGFLFASTKRLLGQTTVPSVKVFEKNIKLEAVVSSIIRNMLDRTSSQLPDVETTDICVGRPVNFECAAEKDRTDCNFVALERMARALEYANVERYNFLLEPIAPVLSHLRENDEERNQDILVLDFGGGTFDLSLIHKRGGRIEVVDNSGHALGGDIITELLVRELVFPKLGLSGRTLSELKTQNNYLEELVPDVLNWRTTYILNQPKYFMRIDDAMRKMPEEAHDLNRLRRLIRLNYGYNLFYAVENAKKALTDNEETSIDLDPIGIGFTVTRSDLEVAIRGYLDLVLKSIESFFSRCRYETSRIGRVLLTGGTSLIPCIGREIDHLFPDRVVAIDPFLSIVKGFAFGAWLYGKNRISLHDGHMRIELD